VLVVRTLGAPPPPARRRRRSRRVEPGFELSTLPLARVTAVRAFAPFEREEDAARWLDEATEAEDTADVLVADGIGLLNRALFVHAVAAADPLSQQLTPERAVAVRIGYGEGEELADSRFTAAREVDVWARNGSPPCSAAASSSTPARRSCCAPAPTLTKAAIVRRHCNCEWDWRRCW